MRTERVSEAIFAAALVREFYAARRDHDAGYALDRMHVHIEEAATIAETFLETVLQKPECGEIVDKALSWKP